MRCTLGVILFLLSALPVLAQPAVQPVPGLPTKEIYDLHIDKKGYLWVAHGLGLSRYDGLNFVHFTHPGQVTLRTTDIVEDPQGRIWCHNFSGQVYYVEQGHMKVLEAYDYRQENQYPRMALFGDELLITSQRGLFVYNTLNQTGRYLYFQNLQAHDNVTLAVNKDGAVVYNNRHWFLYTRQAGLKKIKADKTVMPENGNTLSLQPYAYNDTLYLTANPAGILQKLLLKQGILYAVGNVEYNDYINAVTINKKAWAHTRNESFPNDGAAPISSQNLTDIVTSDEGDTWYSSLKEGLLVSYRPAAWQLIHFPIETGDYIRSLNVSGGYFLGGTQKGNLVVMEKDTGKAAWRHNLFNGYGSIDFIRYYKDHRFLVGSSVNTYIINPKEKKVEALLPLETILDVDFDASRLFLATSSGFYLLPYRDTVQNLPHWLNKAMLQLGRNNKSQKEKEAFLFSPHRTRAVRYDQEAQALFIAGKNGLQQVDENGLRPFYIKGKDVFATSLSYKHPRLYIATINDGLWVKEKEQLRHFTTANALFSNTILRIKITGSYLWLFQNTGLQVFDTEKEQVLQHIDLPILEGDNVLDIAEKDGYAYLATAKGIYKVPMYLSVERRAPRGFVDYVLVNNRDTFFNGDIDLPYHKNDVQFFFSSPTFYDPTSGSFKYRLVGADNDWQVTKPGERMLRYSALQPGSYTFEVAAFNKYGIGQVQPLVFSFRIARPWWSSFWFWVLLNLVVLSIVWLLLRNRVRQKLKLEIIRRNISADLHDDIGATLSSVNIYAALARTEKDNQPYLDLIQQHITDAVTRLDDLVWSINPKNDTMPQMIARMQATANPLLKAAGIACYFDYSDKVLAHKLSLTQKRHLYLLFKELVNNVVKHAYCHNCFIRLESNANLLTLHISDDGQGFDPQEATAGRNGLQNMFARAEKLKADMKIISANQMGSTVVVEIKSNKG